MRYTSSWRPCCTWSCANTVIAAWLITLATLRWAPDELESATQQVLHLIESDGQWFDDWMRYVETSACAGEQLERLLLNMLLRASPAQRANFESQWNDLLSTVVDRRPAPTALPDPRPAQHALQH